MSRKYRVKVNKVPLKYEIPILPVKFRAFNNLYLELLENKFKLKKNPPVPVFVREEPEEESQEVVEDDEYTLRELEEMYAKETATEDEDTYHHEPEEQAVISEPESKPRMFFQEPEPEPEPKDESQEVEDMLFNFSILKRKYPEVQLPNFTEHSDLETMKRVYEKTLRQVSLDSSVDNYKQFFIGGTVIFEWMAVNWMNVDISGYAMSQMASMNKYDRLLLELGEKHYSPKGSRIPVEIRLLGMCVIQAGIFYCQKNMMSGNTNIFSMFGGGGSSGSNPTPRKGRRMRGPSLDPDDLEGLNDKSE